MSQPLLSFVLDARLGRKNVSAPYVSVNSQFSSFDFLQCLTIACCLALYRTLSELHSWGFTVLLVFEFLLYLFEIQD